MGTESRQTLVYMPDDKCLEVIYYCDDSTLSCQQKENFTKLFIQLDDCICTVIISKEIYNDLFELEQIVFRKVINTKGHLC